MTHQSKKTVLSICDIHPLRLGSFEEFLLELSRNLISKGFKHVIVFRNEPVSSVEKAFISTGSEILIFTPSKHSVLNFVQLYCLIKDTNPVIIHFHFYPPFSILNFIKMLTKAKLIHTDHMGVNPRKSVIKRKIRRYYHYINFVLFNYPVDRIICVSNFVRLKYSTEYEINTNILTVIYNGINTQRFSRKVTFHRTIEQFNIEDEFVVTCIAGLRKTKGVQCLIKAAPDIIDKIPKIKFLIVGDGEYRNSLERYINELNLNDKFIFTGFNDSTEVIYSISSCVVIPSLVDEAFCFVAAEAISMEVPVVAFDSGAIKEAFGILKSVTVIPKDSGLLSSSIINILLNPPKKYILMETSNIIKEEYSIEKCVQKYMELYLDILNKVV